VFGVVSVVMALSSYRNDVTRQLTMIAHVGITGDDIEHTRWFTVHTDLPGKASNRFKSAKLVVKYKGEGNPLIMVSYWGRVGKIGRALMVGLGGVEMEAPTTFLKKVCIVLII
jgi:hypothetical protein